MEKLNKEQKLAKIESFVKPLYENGEKPDAIGVVIVANPDFLALVTSGTIGFSEIAPLVKQWGKDNGFVLTKEQREANFSADVSSKFVDEIESWDIFEPIFNSLADKHEVAVKNGLAIVTAHYDKQGWKMPQKISWKKWQTAIKLHVAQGGEVTIAEIDRVIKESGVQNYGNYTSQVYPLVHWLCAEWRKANKKK